MTRETVKALAPRPPPGLFTANVSGQGVAAAVALRVKAGGSQVFEPVARFDAAPQQIRQRADRFEQSGGASLPDPVRRCRCATAVHLRM